MKKMVFIFVLAMAIGISGCGKKETKGTEDTSAKQEEFIEDYDSSELDNYIASVEEKSKCINDYLENDAITQDDMNIKSQELYDLWDEALNYVWKELEKELDESEFVKLRDEQRKWISEKEDKIKEAGKEFEGGSLYALMVNSEGAKITEERVRELYVIYISKRP